MPIIKCDSVERCSKCHQENGGCEKLVLQKLAGSPGAPPVSPSNSSGLLSCDKPTCTHARKEYQKIQDFIISNRLWKGYPDSMSHADIIIELARLAIAT